MRLMRRPVRPAAGRARTRRPAHRRAGSSACPAARPAVSGRSCSSRCLRACARLARGGRCRSLRRRPGSPRGRCARATWRCPARAGRGVQEVLEELRRHVEGRVDAEGIDTDLADPVAVALAQGPAHHAGSRCSGRPGPTSGSPAPARGRCSRGPPRCPVVDAGAHGRRRARVVQVEGRLRRRRRRARAALGQRIRPGRSGVPAAGRSSKKLPVWLTTMSCTRYMPRGAARATGAGSRPACPGAVDALMKWLAQ
jgi:hypothetical protein